MKKIFLIKKIPAGISSSDDLNTLNIYT